MLGDEGGDAGAVCAAGAGWPVALPLGKAALTGLVPSLVGVSAGAAGGGVVAPANAATGGGMAGAAGMAAGEG